eukprot:g7486.t1
MRALPSAELAALLACMKAWSGELALSRSLAGRKDEVVAAREGRKGLFIAALNQQAKYWRAEAFNAWRRVLLQEKERTDAGSVSAAERYLGKPQEGVSARHPAICQEAMKPRKPMLLAGLGK